MSGESSSLLPLGAVSLVLGDLAGSVRHWEEEPELMAAVMRRHDEIVYTAIDRHDGVRPRDQGEGDSFLAAFSRPSDAMSCALDIQLQFSKEAWPTRTPLALRMAIHTGEVQLRDDRNYVGQAVNRCARLRNAAHGGQILLSQSSYTLLVDHLPPEVELIHLGLHDLKDLARPEVVYQVSHPGLTRDFPPLRDARSAEKPDVRAAPKGRHRVVLADDNYLIREGTVALLGQSDELEVVATAADLPSLMQAVETFQPDVVLTDIRMPPDNSDEGIQAAKMIRQRYPQIAVLVLSQHGEKRYAEELLQGGADGLGYLLKDRLMDIKELIRAITTVVSGGSVLDPRIVDTLVTSGPMKAEVGHFFREGDFWNLGWSGTEFKLKDLRGLHHIHRLLELQGREIHCLELSAELPGTAVTPIHDDGALSVTSGGDAGEILDAEAKAAYKQRLKDLEGDIQEAENFGDSERSSILRDEMAAITSQRAAAVGLGGRDRRAASVSERARVNVTRAIRAAIERMSQYDKEFAAHFDTHVQTGTFCSYRTDANRLQWVLQPPQSSAGPS